MDLSIPIIALVGYLGYAFSDTTKTPRVNKELRAEISKHETPPSKNIYSSTQVDDNFGHMQKLSDINFDKSKFPELTNIVPVNYRPKSVRNVNNQKIQSRLSSDQLINNTIKPKTSLLNSNIKEGFSSLSGLKTDFSHNNMVPYFGSKITQNVDLNNTTNMRRLNGDLTANRRETSPLFNPVQQNINLELFTDKVDKNIYDTSVLKTNILPAPQIMVQPIKEGNDILRPSYKNIDELRIKSNPKISYKNRTNLGGGAYNRGVSADIMKNRPETFYENSEDTYIKDSQIRQPTGRMNFINNKTTKSDMSEFSPQLNPGYIPTGKRNVIVFSPENGDEPFTIAQEPIKSSHEIKFNINGGSNISRHTTRENFNSYGNERDTTTREVVTNPVNTNLGYYQQSPQELKTTVKEGNLFSYSGVSASNNKMQTEYSDSYKSSFRESQNNEHVGYTPGGSRFVQSSDNIVNHGILASSSRDELESATYRSPNGQSMNMPINNNAYKLRVRDDSSSGYTPNGGKLIQKPTTERSDTAFRNKTEYSYSDRISGDAANSLNSNPYHINLLQKNK